MMRITSTSDPLKILLVEDSKGDALLIEKALQAAMPGSYEIAQAQTIEQALQQLEKQSFDVTLLDRSLPDVEGFSGMHSIQNFAPNMPVVFLTAYKDEQIAFEAIENGAQDYLFKDAFDGHVIKRALQYAILRKHFEGVLIMQANFDMLTGLANRMLFDSRLDMALARMKRQDGNIALLYLDLDRFKQVNDTLGHAAGDQLLKETGSRLRQAVRFSDTAARLGGDEFAVLLENLPKPSHAEVVAQKIIQLLEAPFLISGRNVTVGVSIGIAVCASNFAMTREKLMKQADSAMYAAKNHNGSNYQFFGAGEVAETKMKA